MIRIEEICDGAIQRAFEQEAAKVLCNIMDESTDAKSTRSITIKIDFRPTADRSSAEVEIETRSKLAPRTSHLASVLIDEDENGEIAIKDMAEPAQGSLFDRDSGPGVESMTLEHGGRSVTVPAGAITRLAGRLKKAVGGE